MKKRVKLSSPLDPLLRFGYLKSPAFFLENSSGKYFKVGVRMYNPRVIQIRTPFKKLLSQNLTRKCAAGPFLLYLFSEIKVK